MLANFLYVGLGGALGAMSRFGVSQIFTKGLHLSGFWATMSVNIAGSFLMGALAIWLFGEEGQGAHPHSFFLLTGLLGGFTTFSAFSLDAILLAENGRIGLAFFYVLGSVFLAISFLFLGMMFMRARL